MLSFAECDTKVQLNTIRAKKIAKKFGGYNKNTYLCSVKTSLLTTPLSAGSKT